MYKKLYKEIIDNAKKEGREKYKGKYYERHHIVPDFMFVNRKRTGPKGHLVGNPNSIDNMVLLTFQEHLMCHYYLYEILKNSRYEYSAGSAMQFFFTKATGGHQRQLNLSELDKKMLDDMAFLREIGIQCISNARRGKMPVVDAITREKIGSVEVLHPRVLSGEWIHHSKGIKQTWAPADQSGSNNSNYKEMTAERKDRVFKCVSNSIIDERYFYRKLFLQQIRAEFTEFKKLSEVWITNNFTSLCNLVSEYNKVTTQTIIYDPYYRSVEQKELLSAASSKMRWVTNGIVNVRIHCDKLTEYLTSHPEYNQGKKL